MLLQALNMLAGDDLAALDPNGAEFVHLVTEALKLAFADREAYYGDPLDSDIPLATLLSPWFNSNEMLIFQFPVSQTLFFELND